LLITLHADSSLLVCVGFSTSFCPYICGLRHGFVLTVALRLVFLSFRRHFAVALALSTSLPICAFCAITRLTVPMSALYVILLLITLHADRLRWCVWGLTRPFVITFML